MKTRLPIIWLALLTVFQAYTIVDLNANVQEVKDCQASTLSYMKKTNDSLKRIKKCLMPIGKLSASDNSRPAS